MNTITEFCLACCLTTVPILATTEANDEQIMRILAKAEMKHEGIRKVPELDRFHAFGNYLVFPLQNGRAEFKRQYDVVDDVFALGDDGSRLRAILKQDPRKWVVTCQSNKARYGLLKFRHEFRFLKSAPVIEIVSDRQTNFPARFADVGPKSDKLQFEPLAYKNTVGYWVNPKDSPHWNFEVKNPGRFRVRILQGCGKGQGGSDLTIRIGEQNLKYKVRATGQFQAFRWFDAGEIEFAKSQSGQIRIQVDRLAKNAVMDVREIRFEPLAQKSSRPKNDSQPNVVVLYTDDQGTLDANCYGSRDLHTPNIDGLAFAGIRFTQAYAHTVCCPSRAMLMTGRVPQRSNVNNWTQGNANGPPGRNMSLNEKTLAEYFHQAGYRTALFGKWHLGAAKTHGPTKQGFDRFFGIRGGFIDNCNHHYLHGKGYHDLYDGTQEVFMPGEYFPDLVTDRALRFLEENSKSRFLLCVPFNVPHYPEQADPVFDQRYGRLAEPRQSYAKMVSTTDERIGRILRKLDELSIRDNTIVIFMSDNGHSAEDYSINTDQHTSGLPKGHNYGAHGGGGNTGKWRGHKGTFYEGGIRVPAIISFPAELPQGQVRDQAMTACDWLPTLLDLCGIQADPDRVLDGKSLVPVIRYNAPSPHPALHWAWQNRWAVRQGNWKLIASPKSRELLNLGDDEPEKKNYLKEKPEIAQKLQELHDQWTKELAAESR